MSVPLWSALLWSDWDFNQINNDSDGDEDGVQDSQDSDPRNASLSRDWNHDGDGMSDVWEYRYQLALRSSSDAGQAGQLYTIANLPPLESYEDFVAAWTADVNNVGMTPEDAYAQMQQTRQDVLASWLLIDPDGDGLGNLREFQLGTHPHIADTDGDGTNDLAEMQGGSDPTNIVSVPPPASGGTSTQAGGSTDSSGTSNSGSGSGGSPSPPVIDGEVELVTRSASGSLNTNDGEGSSETVTKPFSAQGEEESESLAWDKYNQAVESAENITDQQQPHEEPAVWQYQVAPFDPTTGTFQEPVIVPTESMLQEEAQREMEGANGADLTLAEGQKPWKWKVEGTRQETVSTGGGGTSSSSEFGIRVWGANPGEVNITHDAEEIAAMTQDAPVSWLADVLTPPSTALSEQQWLGLSGGGMAAAAEGKWTSTDTGGPVAYHFPSGEAVEARLRRRDVSDSTIDQRITRTFLHVTQRHTEDSTAENAPPTVSVVTLTIEPGHKVSTTGTGPGVIDGGVLLLGTPDESDKSATISDSLLPVEIDYIARNPTTGAFENLGGVIPESRPTPDVNIQVGNVQLTGSGGAQLSVSGTVSDPLAGLLQGSGPETAKILFDGEVIETVSLSGGSGGTMPIWQPHANQTSFSRTITIPTVRAGPHVVRVHTTSNSANEVGWDQATIVVRKYGLPFAEQTPPAANQPASAYPGYVPVTIAFSGALSSTSADSISLTQNGTPAVTLSESASAPTSLAFSGGSAALHASVELDTTPTLDPAQIDVLQATAEITLASGTVARLSGVWTETGTNTKAFTPTSFRFLEDANPVGQRVVDSVQHTTKQHTGSLTPFVVRISVPESMAEMLTQQGGPLSITVGGQQATVVRDDAFNVGGVQSGGMASLFLAKDNKPQVFAAVEERQGDLLPPGVFQAGGLAVGLKQQGGDDMPLSEAPILEEDDPPAGTASGAGAAGSSQAYDLAEVMRWLAVLDEMADGKLINLLTAYQSLGDAEFRIEVTDLWDLTDWDGYHIKNTAQRHENAGLPCIIQIDDDFPSAIHAAQALAQAIMEVRSTVWRWKFETLDTGDPIADYKAMFGRMAVALDNTATAAQIGLGLLNEGADWVLTIPEIAGSIEDGKHKQAGIQAGAMVIPFVSGAVARKGIGLYLNVSGELIRLPDEMLDALVAGQRVAKEAHGQAASRVEAMKVLGPHLQSGSIDRETMRKLVKAELFLVDEGASRAYLRAKLGITDPNIKAHHDLPIAKEFHEKFLVAGLDPNDPQFGRPVSAATHKIWHEQKDVAFGGPFNAVWREFFDNNENATAQQILAHLQLIRSGHEFEVMLKNGTTKLISF